jgi:hypothetical protein
VIHPKPPPPPDPTKPVKPRPQTTMKDLPSACRAVLAAP